MAKEKFSMDLEDDDPVARRQVKRAMERSTKKSVSKSTKHAEAERVIATAQVSKQSKQQRIPLAERGFKTRDPITNELVPLKSTTGFVAEKSKQQDYPEKVAVSHEEAFWLRFFPLVTLYGGNVTKACKEMHIGITEVNQRKRQDPVFRRQLEEARAEGIDMLEDEVVRRAVDGIEKPVGFYKGTSTETETVYSDSLLMFMLKASKPEKYAERTRNENLNLNADLDKEQLEHARKVMMLKLAGADDEDSAPVIEAEVEKDLGEKDTPTLAAPGEIKSVTQWDVED